MRPKEPSETGQLDFCRAWLDQIIDLNHPLARLARTTDWGFLVAMFGAVYEDRPGHPPLPTSGSHADEQLAIGSEELLSQVAYVAYHEYEGIALAFDEQKRVVADLATKPAMILRNYGLSPSMNSRRIGPCVSGPAHQHV